MKVLIFINSLGAGGAERSMVELAKYLKEQGVNVKFVCLERRKVGVEDEVLNFGLDTIYLDQRNKGTLNELKFIIGVIKKEKPDILHSVLTKSNLILRLSKIFINQGHLIQSLVSTPYSLERKKDSKLSWKKFLVMKQIDKWSARLTQNIFYHAITHQVLHHYYHLYKIKENFEIVYRGRKENQFCNEKKSPNFTIINSGRHEFAKGQIDILKALVYIEKKYNIKDIHFELLGREGEYTSTLKEFILKNNLSERVNLLGFVTNVEERLSKAHIFIFPSYYEGLGGALLEAFAAKLPCVCSDIPVLKEVVGKKDGALFAEPGNYQEIGEHIVKLYKDDNLRLRLSDYAYMRYQNKFKLEEINSKMLSMYKKVIGE